MSEIRIDDLERKIAELELEKLELERTFRSSTSWRLTAPLRATARLFRQRREGEYAVPPELTPSDRPSASEPTPAMACDPGVTPPMRSKNGGFTDAQLASGAYWDRVRAAQSAVPGGSCWTDPTTLRHINRIVCGEAIDGGHAGFHRRLAASLRECGQVAPRAISVGSGPAHKEFGLLQAGIVGSFDCYEVAAEAVESGRRLAAEQGMSNRLRMHRANALALELRNDFDLVYWNNSLSNMPDTAAAVAWSRDRLRSGGAFALDDYVGANRFQHSDAPLAWANRIRALLPDRLLTRWAESAGQLTARVIGRIDPQELADLDPTHAVDSINILPAIRRLFPSAEIIPTGGALWVVALDGAFHNFVSEEDLCLLNALLLVDEAVGQLGETQYAVALAIKT